MSTDGREGPVEERTRRLSLAVRLRDAFTGEPLPARHLPAGGSERLSSGAARRRTVGPSVRTHRRSGGRRTSGAPTVWVPGVDAEPVRNPSGYLLYFEEDLPRDGGEVEVRVSGGSRYLDASEVADPGALDERHPVVTVTLLPAPGYRFTAGTTLIRGHVLLDEDGDVEDDIAPDEFGLGGVSVSLDGVDRSATTTSDGEFVLSLTGLAAADVDDDGRVRIGDASPGLVVDHPALGGATAPVEIREGKTACYHLRYAAEDEVSYRSCDEAEWRDATP